MKQGYGNGDGFMNGDGVGIHYHYGRDGSDGGYGDGYGEYGSGTGDGCYRDSANPYFDTGDGMGNNENAWSDWGPPLPETDLTARLAVANCMSRDAVHDACLAFALAQGD